MRHYYAIGNHYKTETGNGFCNSYFAIAFDNAEDRDEWIKSDKRSVDVKCNRKTALTYERNNYLVEGKTPPNQAQIFVDILERSARYALGRSY